MPGRDAGVIEEADVDAGPKAQKEGMADSAVVAADSSAALDGDGSGCSMPAM